METETKRGGKREGLGRKKGLASIKAEEARAYLAQRISDEIEPIFLGLLDMAKGAYKEVKKGEEIIRVYERLPNTKVGAYLLDQVIGKPAEYSQITFGKMTKPEPRSDADRAKINRILGIT